MKIEFVRLLQIQRELYEIPRGRERFEQYLRTIVNSDGTDVRLPPLVTINPMAKDHLPKVLDTLESLRAEELGNEATREATSRLADLPGDFKLGLVVADDLMGGWTNRYTSEFAGYVGGRRGHKRGWLTAALWSSDKPSAAGVRQAVLSVISRTVYVLLYGPASNLKDLMAQEGFVMAQAGCSEPSLDCDDLEYTRQILKPHLSATDQPTLIACLFGDPAARALGYPSQGLSQRAGLALALSNARTKLHALKGQDESELGPETRSSPNS